MPLVQMLLPQLGLLAWLCNSGAWVSPGILQDPILLKHEFQKCSILISDVKQPEP